MHFSELYSVTPGPGDDWFDTLLPADTNLCVDPFLIYEEETEPWASAHDEILDFFAMVFRLVRDSEGNPKTNAWKQAANLLIFPEPSEFCLGVADGSPQGAGSGRGLQQGMLEGIKTSLGLGIENVPHMEMLALFQGGMGLDRISDIVCNVLKGRFIKYTQEVCEHHSIPMQEFVVKNASWSRKFAQWRDQRVQLPLNPFTAKPQPVLLVPHKFLRDIPVVTANEFWTYAWKDHSDQLRGSFNYDIARNVPPRVKAQLARQNPEIVKRYLTILEGDTHEPYPLNSDPKLLVNWYEAGNGIAERLPLSFSPQGPEQFDEFIKEVVDSFRHYIEEQDGWQMLWADNKGRSERIVQSLFRGTMIHYCRAHNVDMTGESNAGRGPVDFKFSQGWESRALVEIKLMRNSAFWDGILAQTPQYLKSEEVKSAYFVAIAYLDKDLEGDRREKLERAAEIVSRTRGVEVTPIIIDARSKESASNLQASQEDRDDLHERGVREEEDSPLSNERIEQSDHTE